MNASTLGAALLAACLALPPAARAGDWTSDFADLPHSRARLVAGPVLEDGARLIGVEIALDAGWHTYWRQPGDSGVPPVFDWAGSQNLGTATVRWPAPRALTDPYGTSIGYEDEVIFPVRITARAAGRPVGIRLALSYAVCAEVCIPLETTLSLVLPPGSPPPQVADLVAGFDAEVPPQQAGGGSGPAVLRAWPEARDGGVVLIIEAQGKAPASAFLEGPEAFYFAVTQGKASGEGKLTFAVEVDGARTPADLDGTAVTATIVAADGAVEHSWTIE